MKKKILSLGILIFLVTGCYYWPTVKGVKKYGLDDCNGLTIEESVDKYLKGTTWDREDKDTYLVKGTGAYQNNNEPIEIHFKLKDKKIEIEHYYVDGFDRLEKADTYLYPNLCPNRKVPDNDISKGASVSCTGMITREGVDIDTNILVEFQDGSTSLVKMVMKVDTGVELSDEEILQTKEEMLNNFNKNNSAGISYDIERDGKTGLKQTLIFDFKNFDFGDLGNFMELSDDVDDSSIDAMIEGFESMGLTCN